MMCTNPSYQGRGAASLQLSWAIDLADEKYLTCWVEASPTAAALYQKFGFEAQETAITQLDERCGGGEYISTCMMREPKNVQSEGRISSCSDFHYTFGGEISRHLE